MKFSLVFAPLLLTVAMVACSIRSPYRRPSNFGRKYVVYGDTEKILCLPHSSCTTEWYQTQYFQNMDNDGVILHIDTNENKVQEQNFYIQRIKKYYLHRLDVSKNKCSVKSLLRAPVLQVPDSFTYQGEANIRGKICEIWQDVGSSSADLVVISRWYVHYNSHYSRYEPVRYEYIRHGTNNDKAILSTMTYYNGYNPDVSGDHFKLPEQCH